METSLRYRAILFDLDDTLLDFSRCENHAIQTALLDNHIVIPDDKLGEFLEHFEYTNASLWARREEIGLLSIVSDSYSTALDAVGLNSMIAPLLAECYIAAFSTTTFFEPNAINTLSFLSRDLPMAVITNGVSPFQERRIASAGIGAHFNHVIVSDTVGFQKPDPAIFRIALDRMHLSAAEVLYVGDSIRDDYFGAIAAGIDFCWYNKNRRAAPSGVDPMFTIHDLMELNQIAKRIDGVG